MFIKTRTKLQATLRLGQRLPQQQQSAPRWVTVAAWVLIQTVIGSAQAQESPIQREFTLACGQNARFRPGLHGYYDLVTGSITTLNGSIAKGSAGTVGMGTAGEIEIEGLSNGSTTISYRIRNWDGYVATVRVAVTVNCPPPPPKPRPPVDPPPLQQPNPQLIDSIGSTPTHRTASCPACRQIAEQLN